MEGGSWESEHPPSFATRPPSVLEMGCMNTIPDMDTQNGTTWTHRLQLMQTLKETQTSALTQTNNRLSDTALAKNLRQMELSNKPNDAI